MNQKEVGNSSVEIGVKAGVIKVDHDLDQVEKFSESKKEQTQDWEKHLFHIEKGCALTHHLKFNLMVVLQLK